jgi:hypothetical protein
MRPAEFGGGAGCLALGFANTLAARLVQTMRVVLRPSRESTVQSPAHSD